MTVSMQAILASLLLCQAEGAAQAKPPQVALLPAGQCNDDENGNDQIHLRGTYISGRCLLQRLPVDQQEGASEQQQTRARILLDGEPVTLIRTSSATRPAKRPSRVPTVGSQEQSVYASADGRVRVSLKARVTTSSCKPHIDTCCGDHYDGHMTVERAGESSVVAIDYYRGG